MATFYIIDGPDGAGKTTLVKKIIEANPGAITMHFGKPNSDEEAYNYWKVYLAALKKSANAPVVIFDRSWYSDMVYGPVMRGREEMTKENMETLELAVRALGGGLILYCTGKPEVYGAAANNAARHILTGLNNLRHSMINTKKSCVCRSTCQLSAMIPQRGGNTCRKEILNLITT